MWTNWDLSYPVRLAAWIGLRLVVIAGLAALVYGAWICAF